ncbi:MAG: DNA-binding protein [Thermodesulfobacteriota bacterium]
MHAKWSSCLAAALCLFLFAACDGKKQDAAPAAPQAGQEAAPAAAITFPVKGKAKEVLSGSGYTYVLIAAEGKEVWTAVPGTEVAVGEEVTVASGDIMVNFPSRTLNRTFSQIVFAKELEGKAPKDGNPQAVAPAAGKAAPAEGKGGDSFQSALNQEGGNQAMPMGQPEVAAGSGKAIVPFVELKVEKAAGENGRTVAEIFAKAKELGGKKVKVRGQVVKFSPAIMGKNWLHIQDGTGDPMKNTHDLVVTTASEAAKGDMVTVEGVLAADKDFGYGYKYDVIVEDAAVSK